MLCMGPEPPDPKKVKAAFDDVMALLKYKYGIQHFAPDYRLPLAKRDEELREERNNNLKDAISGLFELQNWEDW